MLFLYSFFLTTQCFTKANLTICLRNLSLVSKLFDQDCDVNSLVCLYQNVAFCILLNSRKASQQSIFGLAFI